MVKMRMYTVLSSQCLKSTVPDPSRSLLTNAFLFSSRNWLGIRPVHPPFMLHA